LALPAPVVIAITRIIAIIIAAVIAAVVMVIVIANVGVAARECRNDDR
jgi:hypothetical protein